MNKNMEQEKKYQAVSVTVDNVVFTIEDGKLKVLLINRAEKPFVGSWALPGGFLLEGEDTKQAAQRILADKAGVKDVYIEQLYTFDDLKRDPRGYILSVAYFSLVNRNKINFQKNEKTQEPVFYSVRELPELAFDHEEIIEYALKRLRYKLEYTNVVFSLLEKKFTFAQLQNAYEVILNKKIDKRNFRKKFLTLDLIRPVKGKSKGGRQRPAQFYSFISSKPTELKRFF